MRYFGSINAVKVKWSRLFYKKYVLLFTDLGIYGLYAGDLFTRREKIKFLGLGVLLGIFFKALFGDPIWLGAQGASFEEILGEALKAKIRWVKDAELDVILGKADISIPYNKVKRVFVNLERGRVKFKLGRMKNYEFIVGVASIGDVLTILTESGFKYMKSELSRGG